MVQRLWQRSRIFHVFSVEPSQVVQFHGHFTVDDEKLNEFRGRIEGMARFGFSVLFDSQALAAHDCQELLQHVYEGILKYVQYFMYFLQM